MSISAIRKAFRPEHRFPAFGAVEKGRDGAPDLLRLSWVWTTQSHRDANLGDALSAVLVSVLSGLQIKRVSFDSPSERLAAVGTIGHAFHSGTVHFWGTGFDMARNRKGALVGYELPEDTDMVVHAVRGRETARALRAKGLHVPEIYGDPVWFLPKLLPDRVEKTHELGVIVHISELETPNAASLVKDTIERYKIPAKLASKVRTINTYAPASPAGLMAKVEEILSCRRIVSTSLHGLVIAETYGIPCAWFASYPGLARPIHLGEGQPIDHRMRDFYSGVDRDYVLTYCQPSGEKTDWIDVFRFLDKEWKPVNYTGKQLFNAFPLKNHQRFSADFWRDAGDVMARLPV